MSQFKPTSTRPYFVRAIYEWCTDNGFTPYLGVKVDKNVQVPMEFVNHGEIVLNISFDATSGLEIGNDYIRFQARFAGVAREIIVPVSHVIAVYARENGQGMQFPAPVDDDVNVQGPLSSAGAKASSKLPEKPPAIHLVDNEPEDAQTGPNASESGDEPDDEPPQGGSGQGNGGKSKKPSLRIVK